MFIAECITTEYFQSQQKYPITEIANKLIHHMCISLLFSEKAFAAFIENIMKNRTK